MSSTVRASSSFFASFASSVSVEISQGGVTRSQQKESSACSSFASQRARDSFECGAPARQPATRGGCIPSAELPTSQQQQPDLSMVASALQMMGSMLEMISGFLGGSQQAGECADGSQASPGASDDCGSPASPSSDNCHGSPSSSPSSDGCSDSPSSQPGGKTWDVFFDAKQGTKTKQKSPIILDLNGNGKADITGGNIKGNGKLEGKTVKGFDLDPNARQWESKSEQRRPGSGAPALPKGTTMQVFDKSGKLVAERPVAEAAGKGKKADKNMGLAPGQHAEFRDQDGKLVGELKADGKKGKMMYFWGNKNENEWTKPWDANGGDGILAWDQDGDGKITSSKELFGEWDVDGQKKFQNGYEKLAAHFDKDGNGVVEGSELNGLKVWEDRNGDGVTQKGELVDLASRGVKSLNVKFDQNDMSSTFGK